MLALILSKVPVLFETGGATLYSRPGQSYIVIIGNHTGHRVPTLLFPFFYLAEAWLGYVFLGGDTAGTMDVLDVTSSSASVAIGTETWDDTDILVSPAWFNYTNGHLLLGWKARGGVLVWTGHNFQLDPSLTGLLQQDQTKPEQGWSKKVIPLGTSAANGLLLSVALDEQSELTLEGTDDHWDGQIVTVYLRKKGQPAKQLWKKHFHWNVATPTAYQKVFGPRLFILGKDFDVRRPVMLN